MPYEAALYSDEQQHHGLSLYKVEAGTGDSLHWRLGLPVERDRWFKSGWSYTSVSPVLG